MKKLIVIILTCVVCAMLIASGCTSSSGTTTATTTAAPAASTVETTAATVVSATVVANATTVPAANATATTAAANMTAAPTTAATNATTAPASSWTGTWNTSYSSKESGQVIELLTLTQTGSSVTGTYAHGNGTVTATVQDASLAGTWNETDNAGAYTGFFVFEKSGDDKTFAGKWVYTNETKDALKNTTQSWTGVRA